MSGAACRPDPRGSRRRLLTSRRILEIPLASLRIIFLPLTFMLKPTHLEEQTALEVPPATPGPLTWPSTFLELWLLLFTSDEDDRPHPTR